MSKFGEVERGHENHGEGVGENLKVFEKTWGHRLLIGLSICMFVGGLILAIYCAMRLQGVSVLAQDSATYAFAYAIYITGLVMGAAMLPPAVLGIVASAHPKLAPVAAGAAVLAFVLDVIFVIYAASLGGQAFSIVLYSVLFAVVPALYLAASLKIMKSRKTE